MFFPVSDTHFIKTVLARIHLHKNVTVIVSFALQNTADLLCKPRGKNCFPSPFLSNYATTPDIWKSIFEKVKFLCLSWKRVIMFIAYNLTPLIIISHVGYKFGIITRYNYYQRHFRSGAINISMSSFSNYLLPMSCIFKVTHCLEYRKF